MLRTKKQSSTGNTMKDTFYDHATMKTVKKDVTLEEHFSDDPEALKVLGAKKGFFDGF